jgi:hypothetical protein
MREKAGPHFRDICLYSDLRKLFVAGAIQKRMKVPILVLHLLVTLALAGAVVGLFLKVQEKAQIIQELEARKQAEGQKAIAAQKEGEEQKQLEAEMKLDAQKQLEAGKIRMIDDDLDKIDARLQKVLDEPSGYASETKAQRDTQEDLLLQLAGCVKTEIGILQVEMLGDGFTKRRALEENLGLFFANYETKIHNEHLSFDYIDLGLKDSDHKSELDAEAMKSLQAAFAAKRAIHNLKSNRGNPAK